MRVIHLVPSAFDYFEDIRTMAFGIVEELDLAGVDSEIITLQYGTPARSVREAAQTQEIKRSYKGIVPTPQLLDSLLHFDIVHFHVPLLGFLGKFLKWYKQHPEVKIVLSYYRPVQNSDVISWFIAWYNRHYLPLLAHCSQGLIYFTDNTLRSITAKMIEGTLMLDATSFMSKSLEEKNQALSLLNRSELGQNIIALYSELLYTTTKSNS